MEREGSLLILNLATDADDPILGFTTRWVTALAGQWRSVEVITMRAGRILLPDNVTVYSLGKELGRSEAARVATFYGYLRRIVRRQRISACFSHMIPILSVLAAPVLKARGIPLVTWYAHPRVTWSLRLAHYLSDAVVASVPSAYPYRKGKLRVVGQGIDTELFSPECAEPARQVPLVLSVGRLSPVKRQDVLVEATALLRERWRRRINVVFIGGPAVPGDVPYVSALREKVGALGLEKDVSFVPAMPMNELVPWYRRCALHVSLTPTGFGDKVAWEAMSCGRPVVASNEGYRETLGRYGESLLFRYGDSEHLASRMEAVLALTDNQRSEMGDYLRERVIELHGLKRLARRLSVLMEELVLQRSRGGAS